MHKTLLGAAASVALMIFGGSAHAAIDITNVSGDVLAPGFTDVATFDAAPPTGYTVSGVYSLFPGGVGGAATPPGDATEYVALQTGQSLTLHSDAGFDAFSFYMGSPDSYNSVTVDGQTFSGSAMMGTPVVAADGNQSVGRTVTYDLGVTVHDVTFSSSGVAFEFDNVAVSAAPEPAEWALMMLGLGGLGLVLRANRRAERRTDASSVAA